MAETIDITASDHPAQADKPMRARDASHIHGHPTTSAFGLTLAALGVVFGDIGTSPLYTMKTVLALAGGRPDSVVIMGVLSLLIWTLVVITTIKYVGVAMSIANDGEGGILALMSLLTGGRRRPVLAVVGLIGAALIYGDGAITPAISVMSSLEGLTVATKAVEPYVLPAAVAILLLLFLSQPLGTERIGKAFGPIMAVWFTTIAVLGVAGIVHHPSVLAAVDPLYAVHFLARGGMAGFLILGGVFLCVTGAEALYADHGPFRRAADPHRLARARLSEPRHQLCGAGRDRAGGRVARGQHLLSPLPHAAADPARGPGDAGHHYRQPGHHHGRLFDDAAGRATRLAAGSP